MCLDNVYEPDFCCGQWHIANNNQRIVESRSQFAPIDGDEIAILTPKKRFVGNFRLFRERITVPEKKVTIFGGIKSSRIAVISVGDHFRRKKRFVIRLLERFQVAKSQNLGLERIFPIVSCRD